MKSYNELLEEEDRHLSDIAVKNSETVERMYPEEEHPYRLPLSRDRDRIVHSRSFKRLEYKTQVFINSEGDNYRTRLTHTLEVAGVSRTICRVMGLNSHLGEVIALAHDLGHTPFGHAGQDILSELMKDFGGFEHNKQSLRIVEELENRYSEFPGLNLSRMSLIGLMKHGGEYEKSDLSILREESGPGLESLITDCADEIAYNSHDIEDGIERNLIHISQLNSLAIWQRVVSDYRGEKDENSELYFRKLLRSLMNTMVSNLIESTEATLKKEGIRTRKDFSEAWKSGKRPVGFSLEMSDSISELKKFLSANLYNHPDVVVNSNRGKRIIEFLFGYLKNHSEKIPEKFLSRRESDGIYRVLSDYISGMTDRYAESKADEFGFKD